MRANKTYNNILCVRADNMGDVIMSGVAIRALKDTFHSRIGVLTSSAGAAICRHLDGVDEVIVYDLPWIKTADSDTSDLMALVQEIRDKKYDAAVIFTVYSQSALPAAVLLYMAQIPIRIAYCRENPYELLTHWVVEREPYHNIRHQIERDLYLAEQLGAIILADQLQLRIFAEDESGFYEKLKWLTPDMSEYLVLHPGVSEPKRMYPVEYWIEVGKQLAEQYQISLLISGSYAERTLTETIARGIGKAAVSVAGLFTLGEFICLLDKAYCIVSVNTATIHIAAARQTPIVVLYAQTNPQHTPWKCPAEVLYFSVPDELKSKNEIIKWVTDQLYPELLPYPDPKLVVSALSRLLENTRSVK